MLHDAGMYFESKTETMMIVVAWSWWTCLAFHQGRKNAKMPAGCWVWRLVTLWPVVGWSFSGSNGAAPKARMTRWAVMCRFFPCRAGGWVDMFCRNVGQLFNPEHPEDIVPSEWLLRANRPSWCPGMGRSFVWVGTFTFRLGATVVVLIVWRVDVVPSWRGEPPLSIWCFKLYNWSGFPFLCQAVFLRSVE